MRADHLGFATIIDQNRNVARVRASRAVGRAYHGASLAAAIPTAALRVINLTIRVVVNSIADFWPDVFAAGHRIADVERLWPRISAFSHVTRQAVGTGAGIAHGADVPVVAAACRCGDEALPSLGDAFDGLTCAQPLCTASDNAGRIEDALCISAILVAEPTAIAQVAIVVIGTVGVFQARTDADSSLASTRNTRIALGARFIVIAPAAVSRCDEFASSAQRVACIVCTRV